MGRGHQGFQAARSRTPAQPTCRPPDRPDNQVTAVSGGRPGGGSCVDLHCGGEPARVLLAGCPPLPGSSVREMRKLLSPPRALVNNTDGFYQDYLLTHNSYQGLQSTYQHTMPNMRSNLPVTKMF